jgi:hypothetical protein
MADITMCSNTTCPNAPRCYRAQAEPSHYWQSRLSFPYAVGVNGVECQYYVPMYQTKVTDNTRLRRTT